MATYSSCTVEKHRNHVFEIFESGDGGMSPEPYVRHGSTHILVLRCAALKVKTEYRALGDIPS